METTTVPCKICSEPTTMTGTCLCDRCWELDRRISDNSIIARRILKSHHDFQVKISRGGKL